MVLPRLPGREGAGLPQWPFWWRWRQTLRPSAHRALSRAGRHLALPLGASWLRQGQTWVLQAQECLTEQATEPNFPLLRVCWLPVRRLCQRQDEPTDLRMWIASTCSTRQAKASRVTVPDSSPRSPRSRSLRELAGEG